MKQFIEMLRKFDTVFTVINEEEIAIPVVAIAATEEQGELLPQDMYQENALLADEMMVHLTFRDGRIDWTIICEMGGYHDEVPKFNETKGGAVKC